jgi:hypothetical protein
MRVAARWYRAERLIGLGLLALGITTAPAGAAVPAARLSLTVSSSDGHTIWLRESGFTGHNDSFVFVFLSQAGLSCAATPQAERAKPRARLEDSFALPAGRFSHLAGDFTVSPATGRYRLCGYLSSQRSVTTSPEAGPPDATATVVFQEHPHK